MPTTIARTPGGEDDLELGVSPTVLVVQRAAGRVGEGLEDRVHAAVDR